MNTSDKVHNISMTFILSRNFVLCCVESLPLPLEFMTFSLKEQRWHNLCEPTIKRYLVHIRFTKVPFSPLSVQIWARWVSFMKFKVTWELIQPRREEKLVFGSCFAYIFCQGQNLFSYRQKNIGQWRPNWRHSSNSL